MPALDTTTLLVAVRESLEAFLILSILTGLVVKLGRPELKKHLLWGAAAAVAVSIIGGILVEATLAELYGETPEEAFAGIASLAAVAILTYMIVWMYRHTLTMVEELRQRVHRALDAGRPAVLFALAFVAVAREGLETVLFIGSRSGTTSGLGILLAVLVGLVISATVAFLLFTGIVRLNVRAFFGTSGVLLIFFAGGILVYGLHELMEIGWIPETAVVWDTSGVLNHKEDLGGQILNALFGYRHQPRMLELVAYVAYVGGILTWYLRGILRSGRPGHPAARPASA